MISLSTSLNFASNSLRCVWLRWPSVISCWSDDFLWGEKKEHLWYAYLHASLIPLQECMSILTLGHFCYKVTLQCEDTQLCATFREPKAQCQIWSLFLFFRWYTSINAYTESCNTCTSTQVDSGSLLYTLAPHVTACQCKHLAIIGSKQHFIKKAGTIIIL